MDGWQVFAPRYVTNLVKARQRRRVWHHDEDTQTRHVRCLRPHQVPPCLAALALTAEKYQDAVVPPGSVLRIAQVSSSKSAPKTGCQGFAGEQPPPQLVKLDGAVPLQRTSAAERTGCARYAPRGFGA